MTETGIGFEFVHEAHFSADRNLMKPFTYGKVLGNQQAISYQEVSLCQQNSHTNGVYLLVYKKISETIYHGTVI